MKSWKFWLPLVIFIGLVALLLFGLTQDPREVPSPLVDHPIPTFDLPDLQNPNKRITDQDLRGQVVLFNVWASWCYACRAEHEMLMHLAQNSTIKLIGLNWKDQRTDALAVLENTGNPYAMIGYDPDNDVGIDWGVYGAPETFIIDRQGMIRHKHIGPIDQRVWDETLQPLINTINAE
jgi:cytochrome c biogenesis protein CcmG/thiol:disulfide interchange protein DsbE